MRCEVIKMVKEKIEDLSLFKLTTIFDKNVQRNSEIELIFMKLVDSGEIIPDDNFDVIDHREYQKAIFENKDYVSRVLAHGKLVTKAYQEFEKRLDTYKNNK
jgi:3-isopropylmalate dehydratase small subunit